ncbi:MAG: hypothetical protein ACYTFQ_03630 [Planctomycetota bacterium]|jgi:hypothetical protein
MSNLQLSVTCMGLIVLLAVYWTLWKTRNDLIEGRENLKSQLSDIQKLLESKADKA